MNEARHREVVQLLRDYRAFYTPGGGAAPTDGTLNLEEQGSYGPAGLILAGSEFGRLGNLGKREIELYRKSFEELLRAVDRMSVEPDIGRYSIKDPALRERYPVLNSPIEGRVARIAFDRAYFSDPGDFGVVDEWRRKASAGYINSALAVDEHDAGARWVANHLEDADLYVVMPKAMTEDEERRMEKTNAEMYAVYQRLKRGGLNSRAALAQTADNYRVPVDRVEVVIQFRQAERADQCTREGCQGATFALNLCQAHYQDDYRRRREERAGKRSRS